MPHCHLPSLLFRQALVIALVAGACAVRAPAVGAALLVMLAFVPEREDVRHFLLKSAKLLSAFLLGFIVMRAVLPDVPDKPSWAAVPRQAVLVEGEVDSAAGLPGGRVRLILRDLHQAAIPSGLEREHEERIRKALRPPRFGAVESGKKSYAGGLFNDAGAVLPGAVSLTLDARMVARYGRPLPGQRVTALVRLFPSGGSRNAEESGPGAYWAAREVWHNARLVWSRGEALFLHVAEGESWTYAAALRRESWRKAMTQTLGGEQEGVPAFSQGRAMLIALLFGDRSVLSQRTIELFTRAGLVHSLALSGQHLALAAMFGVLSVFLFSRFRPCLFRSWPRRTLIACAGMPFALCYLFLGGAPFSLVRAAFMMLAGAVFLCTRRTVAPLDALFAAAFMLFLLWPPAVFDLSAQLSVLAVAGIMLSLPLLAALNEKLAVHETRSFVLRAGRKIIRAALSLLIVSFAAQTAVLPVLAIVFGTVSPCFWLNLVWLPLLTFLTLPLAACALFVQVVFDSQSVSVLLFTAAAWPADMMLSLLAALDGMGWLPLVQCFRPEPLCALGYGAVLVALALTVQSWFAQKAMGPACKRILSFGLLLLLIGFVPRWLDDVQARQEERITLSMIDVGSGQAVLLEYPGGRILVDGGGNASPFFDCGRSIVAPALTDGRLPHLDAVIVSHNDVDHARGLRWILEHFRVGALYWSPVSAQRAERGEGKALRELAQKHGIPERILRQGEVLKLSSKVKLEVLAPLLAKDKTEPSEKELSSNNASLALRLVRGDQGLALLCGDMLSPALGGLAESGQDLKAEVLVLPHHGAASSFRKEFYDAVSPRAALVSTSPFNHFGFPSRKVREEMALRKIPLFSTSELGTFRVQWRLEDGSYALALPR